MTIEEAALPAGTVSRNDPLMYGEPVLANYRAGRGCLSLIQLQITGANDFCAKNSPMNQFSSLSDAWKQNRAPMSRHFGSGYFVEGTVTKYVSGAV